MPTFTDGTVPTAALLNVLATGITTLSGVALGAPATGQPLRLATPWVRLRRGVPQTIPTGTTTAVIWTVADANTDNMWAPGVGDRVTVRTAGTYGLRAEWRWDATTGGDRELLALLNGLSPPGDGLGVDAAHMVRLLTDGPIQRIVTLLPGLAVGATVTIAAWQDSGGPASSSNTTPVPHMEMWRIGP